MVHSKGYLIPIGGAEDKRGQRLVLEHFVRLAGGPDARIAVLPTASSIPKTAAKQYLEIFSGLGAASVEVIEIAERLDANYPDQVAILEDRTGLFLTGGDQVKLVTLLGGTLIGSRIKQCFEQGATIAGTSAGASALSQHMIAFGRSGSAPSQRMVQITPGLGLAEGIIIDQHFRQRDRVGRLMTAVAYNPAMLGIGLDEDTALVIGPDRQCEVIGSGSVTIIDGSGLQHTNIHSVKGHDPAAVLGVQVHILTSGYRYDLVTRRANPPI